MKNHILIIEDDKKLARLLGEKLSIEGYKTSLAYDGLRGFINAQEHNPALILLSYELPSMSGIEVVRQLRTRGFTDQIILMSKISGPQACKLGLDTGANDYIVKPFAMAELLARVRARLRRAQYDGHLPILQFDELTLDQNSRECYRGKDGIPLTAKEFDLLMYFMQHPQVVLTRQQILSSVWGYTFEVTSNIIDVCIFSIRRKLETKQRKRLIHTIRGVGYVLRKDRHSKERLLAEESLISNLPLCRVE